MASFKGSWIEHGMAVQVDQETDPDFFILRIPKTGKGVRSAAGKSDVLASTRGNVALNDGNGGVVKLGLNLYRSI